MPTPKPSIPAAFRQQMVERVRAGRGINDLAREFSCKASSIHA
jgi:transposase-like protein